MAKKCLVVLGSAYVAEDCWNYLEERGLNIQSYTFLNETMNLFGNPTDDVCGVIMFPIFAAKDEMTFMTTKGPIPDMFRKQIRSACRKQRVPLIEIESFDGSNAVKKRIKTWLRTRVFRG